MFFTDLLDLLMRVGSSILKLAEPMLEFFNNTATIGTVSYSYFELLFGGGLIVVLTWGIIKWILALD